MKLKSTEQNFLKELLLRCEHMGKGKQASTDLLDLSFLIHNTSPEALNLLRSNGFPFLSRQTIDKYYKSKIQETCDNLTDINKKGNMIDQYLSNLVDIGVTDIDGIDVNLAIDAMSIEALFIGEKAPNELIFILIRKNFKNLRVCQLNLQNQK